MRSFKHRQDSKLSVKSINSGVWGRIITNHHPAVSGIIHLQRTIGNQSVQRLLRIGSEKSAPENAHIPKSQLQHADASNGASPGNPGQQQAHSSFENGLMRSSAVGKSTPWARGLKKILPSAGHPLTPMTRAFFEPRFGYDFSHVRIHTGTDDHIAAQSINAQAYTVGRDIVFGKGQYAPETRVGQRLLAHELTHVIHQGAAEWYMPLADKGAGPWIAKRSGGPVIQRQPPQTSTRTRRQRRSLVSERFKNDRVLNKVLNTTRKERFYLRPYLRFRAVRKIKQALIDAGFSLPWNARRRRPTFTFDSETKRAVKQFQRYHGLKGKDVDGWIGPQTLALMDKYIGNVPPRFAGFLQKTVREFAVKLKAARRQGLVIFPYQLRSGQWVYQARQGAWRYISGSHNWQPADPNKPAESIEKLLSEYDEWFFDCGLFTGAAELLAFRRAWKEGVKRYGWTAFNQKFRNMVALQQVDVSKPMMLDTVTRSGMGRDPAFDKVWKNAPVGSKVMWRNRITYVVESVPWKNEWGLKLKHSARPSRCRYAAHPLGYNLTEGQVKANLAKQDTDASRFQTNAIWRFVRIRPRILRAIRAMKLPYDMIPTNIKKMWIKRNILRWKVIRRRFPAPR